MKPRRCLCRIQLRRGIRRFDCCTYSFSASGGPCCCEWALGMRAGRGEARRLKRVIGSDILISRRGVD